jgi:hypothetical protein
MATAASLRPRGSARPAAGVGAAAGFGVRFAGVAEALDFVRAVMAPKFNFSIN